jgi:hypothetical protein
MRIYKIYKIKKKEIKPKNKVTHEPIARIYPKKKKNDIEGFKQV